MMKFTTRHLTVELKGDWSQAAETPRGVPLTARYNGSFSLQIPDPSGEPKLIVLQPGDRIPPEGMYGNATKGKGTFALRLEERFRAGATLVGYAVEDGQEVEPGTILCWVEPIEETK